MTEPPNPGAARAGDAGPDRRLPGDAPRGPRRRRSRRERILVVLLVALAAWTLPRWPRPVPGDPARVPADPISGGAAGDLPPPPALFVWDEAYRVERAPGGLDDRILAANPTPFAKFRLLRDALLERGVPPEALARPPTFGHAELRTAHSDLYLDTLHVLAWTRLGALLGENAIVPANLAQARQAAAGTYLAARLALERGVAMNLGGGYHHAFPDRAEGLCHLNDTAIAIELLRGHGHARRFLVVDLDVHHGNGNAWIYRDDPEVALFDLYQRNAYPAPGFVRTDSGRSFDTGAGPVTDGDYLAALDALDAPGAALDRHRPDLVFYLAGADARDGDGLGGLSLGPEAMRARDARVLGAARERSIPVVVTLAGGYPGRADEGPGAVVRAHLDTALAVARLAGLAPTGETPAGDPTPGANRTRPQRVP